MKKSRNEERNAKYAKDEKFRRKVVAASRKSYRKTHKVRRAPSLNKILAKMPKVGSMKRAFYPTNSYTKIRLTFTSDQLAVLLGRNGAVVKRWLDKDLVPSPVVPIAGDDGMVEAHAYVSSEVLAISKVLIEHFKRTPYYRKDHVETERAVHAAVAQVRKKERITHRANYTV